MIPIPRRLGVGIVAKALIPPVRNLPKYLKNATRLKKFIPLHPRNLSALIYEVNSVRNFGSNGVNEKVLKRVNGKTSHLSADVTG
ncbi:MAG: hypothetical protein A3H71_02210 [Candidatus Sungbacteria bacterium RIFCSPLOWO2_02_FULL_48_13b]|uniref:Uncharacterized protein n=2 Tax=Candidatus Sungiibacteriota TaxID=1817917 RepID=A0A1G2LGA5_9BACT|nr:MAG: hypothetical protein A3C12_03095 [Candidatus Sungbacteria bacterium RIFCSPHIGHO2_02_FULL_49_20]OHA09831.1 MAG: hypothetical protein A3H71_02210 [Candidatus Sungbacteria bacterium RIFCSPLOWO2_02_FULL_48_13b]